MQDKSDLVPLAARIEVLEALAVMTLGHRYVARARQDASYAAQREIARDVRTWFDQVVDASPLPPAAIEGAALRMLTTLDEFVGRRAPPPAGRTTAR